MLKKDTAKIPEKTRLIEYQYELKTNDADKAKRGRKPQGLTKIVTRQD